jgi:hypothetical protein
VKFTNSTNSEDLNHKSIIELCSFSINKTLTTAPISSIISVNTIAFKKGEFIKERRGHTRIRVDLPIIYKISNEKKIIIKESKTYDLSNSGISFYTDMPLDKGLILQVNIPLIWDSPRNAIVSFCIKKNDVYKVGISFQ